MNVADSGVLGGVAKNLCAINGKGDRAHRQDPHLRSHCDHLLEAAFEQRVTGPPEGADAVVVGVQARSEQAQGHVLVSSVFDLATAEGAGREEQSQSRGLSPDF